MTGLGAAAVLGIELRFPVELGLLDQRRQPSIKNDVPSPPLRADKGLSCFWNVVKRIG